MGKSDQALFLFYNDLDLLDVVLYLICNSVITDDSKQDLILCSTNGIAGIIINGFKNKVIFKFSS